MVKFHLLLLLSQIVVSLIVRFSKTPDVSRIEVVIEIVYFLVFLSKYLVEFVILRRACKHLDLAAKLMWLISKSLRVLSVSIPKF